MTGVVGWFLWSCPCRKSSLLWRRRCLVVHKGHKTLAVRIKGMGQEVTFKFWPGNGVRMVRVYFLKNVLQSTSRTFLCDFLTHVEKAGNNGITTQSHNEVSHVDLAQVVLLWLKEKKGGRNTVSQNEEVPRTTALGLPCPCD